MTLHKLYNRFFDEKISQLSGSLAYTTLLAIVPILILLFSLGAHSHVVLEVLDSLKPIIIKNFLPGVENAQISEYFLKFASSASEFTTTGLIMILVTGILMFSEIESAFMHIWNTQERTWFQRILVYTLALTGGPVVMGAAITVTFYVLSYSYGLIKIWSPFATLLDYVAVKGFMLFLFFIMYKYLPNTKVNTRYAFYMSFFVTVAFVLMQWGFQFYLSKFHTYTLMYGAFYLVPILLVWIYAGWCIVLIGALVLHELHTKKAENHVETAR